jgi:TRAP-type C4-dicarboxylate transport system permease small subunit
MNQRMKKIFLFLLDVIEIYIPMIAFLTIFACFLIQIVCRYFFVPLMWPEELALLAFLWAALLGALYAKRQESFVAFTLIYDLVSERGKTIMRIVGNILLIITFTISFKPSLDFVIFQSYKHSAVLFIPMNIVSSAYLVFLFDVTIRYIVDVVKDFKILAIRRPA